MVLISTFSSSSFMDFFWLEKRRKDMFSILLLLSLSAILILSRRTLKMLKVSCLH